jgi:hypothetical protein
MVAVYSVVGDDYVLVEVPPKAPYPKAFHSMKEFNFHIDVEKLRLSEVALCDDFVM